MKVKEPMGNKVPPMKLNDVQKYLIQRIPGVWNINKPHKIEPAAIVKARTLVEEFDKRSAESEKEFDILWKRARREVIDAVYFETAEAAKKKLEALYKRFDIKE